MENIYFDFNGKTYSGYIMENDVTGSGYLWFVFNEEEINEVMGDSVAFHFTNGQLRPVYQYASRASFIEYLRQKVEAALHSEASDEYHSKKK